jgi:hypothetical protein
VPKTFENPVGNWNGTWPPCRLNGGHEKDVKVNYPQTRIACTVVVLRRGCVCGVARVAAPPHGHRIYTWRIPRFI